ncbi:ACT domain-containing protein [Streptomyces goshikiensis]|uniref:ACT domain-containing protein n=1 Tax=Streptomyces TaxID=1883 RepID=UPI0005603EF2|nr:MULTISPECIES: ACT domain-containing protein [Streptomyces]AKL65003.1 acetyltransferase [Streptomyces sp. Mg1]RPK39534.1 ACT domain protein [Streptomyces sp. ADI91-18]WBY18944.1 ACT domain-containing protein [Streptomyces goshikiensis]WSR97638.1 ACT domain-containing protein [Streptomyces goshikiensis]WSY01236.1 ACT domain-containing protein [Streptomyces goshikiensis]
MSGESDLRKLLSGMRPELNEGRYVFCTVPGATAPPDGTAPVATVLEAEGLTLVLRQEDADAAGLAYDYTAGWITLRVHSALDAVGLTGAFAAELAAHGLSCNVIAGYHHDHLFVAADRAAEAVAVLQELATRSAE